MAVRGRIGLNRIGQLEETATDLYTKSREMVHAAERLKTKLLTLGLRLPEDKAMMTLAVEMAAVLKTVPSSTSLLVMAPVLDLMRAANELVLADNALNLGRDGAEKRWDNALHAVKRMVNRFDFEDDIQLQEGKNGGTLQRSDAGGG